MTTYLYVHSRLAIAVSMLMSLKNGAMQWLLSAIAVAADIQSIQVELCWRAGYEPAVGPRGIYIVGVGLLPSVALISCWCQCTQQQPLVLKSCTRSCCRCRQLESCSHKIIPSTAKSVISLLGFLHALVLESN